MGQFCTSCGRPLSEAAAFCAACGARQPASTGAQSASPGQPAAEPAAGVSVAPASTKGSPVLKILAIIAGIIAFLMVAMLGSCVFVAYRVKHRAEQFTAAMKARSDIAESRSTGGNGMPFLPDAMARRKLCITTGSWPKSEFCRAGRRIGDRGMDQTPRRSVQLAPLECGSSSYRLYRSRRGTPRAPKSASHHGGSSVTTV